jgi:outer membrane usher protein FimD/PapC
VFDTGILGLGLSGAGTYWTLADGSTVQALGGLNRAIGRGDVRVSYQFYRTESVAATLLTHTAGLALTVPLGWRTFASIQARIQRGENLVANTLYASLWTSF